MISLNVRYNQVLHLLYWIIATLFLTYFFGHYTREYRYTFLYVLFQLPVVIATTYIINYWLVPKYLFRDRIGRFIYLLVACLVISAWLNALITILAFTSLYHFQADFLPPASFDFKLLTAGLYLVILLGVAIHFTRRSLSQQRSSFEIRKQQMETELLLKETRLKLLQNQLHPHMLFNSLNTIYGLSLQQSDKTSGLILNLSNMLDYMLYQCDTDKIVLKKEIDFLKNYIEIEKQRFSEDITLIIEWPENDEQYLIAPLLLLPIVENCFKHTRHIRDTKPEIHIKCGIKKGGLHFLTSNSYRQNEKSSQTEGIGIRNLKERLALLYPGKYELKNSIQNNHYIVEIVLELDPIKQGKNK